MGRVMAIGERSAVEGYALAGAEVIATDDPRAVGEAWRAIGPDVDLVLLTARAAAAVEATGEAPAHFLVAVLP